MMQGSSRQREPIHYVILSAAKHPRAEHNRPQVDACGIAPNTGCAGGFLDPTPDPFPTGEVEPSLEMTGKEDTLTSQNRVNGTATTDANKAVIRRFIDEVMNGGNLDALEKHYEPRLAKAARRWIAPFQQSFPDMRMEIVDLVAESDQVVGRFRCSGTHLGDWMGHAPTGRRFERIDEVYFFRIRDGKIAEAWGIEDTQKRLEQLGLR